MNIQHVIDSKSFNETVILRTVQRVQDHRRPFSETAVKAATLHIKEGVPFHQSIFRYGSAAYFETINVGRLLYRAGLMENLDWESVELFESDLGQSVNLTGVGTVYLDAPFQQSHVDEAEYKGKEVELNKPKRGGSKKFYVYTKNPKTGKVIKIQFGDTNLTVKSDDPERAKNFAARHRCEKKKDRTKAGYWACRLPRYGLVKGGKWW